MKKLQIVFLIVLAFTALPARADNLISAAKRGDLAAVKAFLAAGVDVNAKDNYGETALDMAAYNGDDAVVKTLLAHGADVNAKDNVGDTALETAVTNGYDAVVKTLLAHGADVNAKDNWGTTALWVAAWRGEDAMVKTLLAHGANADTAIQKLSADPKVIALIKEAQKQVTSENAARLATTTLRQTRNPRLALARLISRLRQDPQNQALRLAVIRIALKMRPAPAIPHAARRALAKGVVLFGEAKSPQDFQAAGAAFQKAADLAPWWPDPYFNLAKTEEQGGHNHAAVNNLRNYLAAAPYARDRGAVRTELYQDEFRAKQEEAAAASLAQRQQNAQTILAYLQANFGKTITGLESCRGYPIIAGMMNNLRCTKDQAAGSNWENLSAFAPAYGQFQYSLIGRNADEIRMQAPKTTYLDFCGTVGSSTSLGDIRWAACTSTDNSKATVSFYSSNQQGLPWVEIDYQCTAYPGNPAETDWCVRQQFTLQKE